MNSVMKRAGLEVVVISKNSAYDSVSLSQAGRYMLRTGYSVSSYLIDASPESRLINDCQSIDTKQTRRPRIWRNYSGLGRCTTRSLDGRTVSVYFSRARSWIATRIRMH